MTPCKFFAQGRCNKGDFCAFEHQPPANGTDHLPALPDVDSLTTGRIVTTLISANRDRKSTCKFFLNGCCRNGGSCPFDHPPGKHPDAAFATPSAQVVLNQTGGSFQSPNDSRKAVPCKFFLRNECRKGLSCEYFHPPGGQGVRASNGLSFEAGDDEVSI